MKADINKKEAINFNNLVETIQKINTEFSIQAKTAVNVSLTLRNWFIGGYIQEYELRSSDKAEYGEKLLSELAKALNGVSNCHRRQLYDYLQFYRVYPQIVGTVSAQLQSIDLHQVIKSLKIVGTATALLKVDTRKRGYAEVY